jgi:dolichol-phosphate mannosyltransferase
MLFCFGIGEKSQHEWNLVSNFKTMSKIISYIKHNKTLIMKFILVSGSAVVLNLLLLYLLVNYLGFNTHWGQNIANAISMEVSILYNFMLSWSITWKDRQREKGVRFLLQIVKFHLTIGITILFRLGLFALLQLTGLHYVLNSAIGIGLASLFNYFVYDTYVFKRKEL